MIRLKFTLNVEYEVTEDPGDHVFDRRRAARGIPDRRLGFSPAFLDFQTFSVYPSRFADGALAAAGRLVPGFVRGGYFYTRTAAARAAREWAGSR